MTPRRVCVAVVVDAGELDDVLKRLALDGLVPTHGSRTVASSQTERRELDVPLLAGPRGWHVGLIVAMAALGAAFGLVAARQINVSGDMQAPPTLEKAPERVPEVARVSSDAGISGISAIEVSTPPAPEPTHAPVQPQRRRGPRATIPSTSEPRASDGPVRHAIIRAPRDTPPSQADAGRDDSEYIREL